MRDEDAILMQLVSRGDTHTFRTLVERYQKSIYNFFLRSAGNVEDAGTTHWLQVHEQFMATKQECGENVEGPTYEKFEKTLKKSQAALMKQHGAKRVKFAVYVKDGKAALKARLIKH